MSFNDADGYEEIKKLWKDFKDFKIHENIPKFEEILQMISKIVRFICVESVFLCNSIWDYT